MTDTTTAVLAEAAKWLHAAYDRPPQTPECVEMLARVDAALAAPAAQGGQPLQIDPVDNATGETLCRVRWFIETPAGWVGAHDKAALEYLLAASAQEEEPAAWLAHGGKTYRDKPFMDKAQAEKSVTERTDGAMVSPLHLHAARAKEGKA